MKSKPESSREFIQTRDPDRARAEFNTVLTMAPDNVRAFNGLGILHGEKRDYPAARRCFERALELNPYQFEAWLNLGITCLEDGDKFRARISFSRALQLDANSTIARQGLERSLRR